MILPKEGNLTSEKSNWKGISKSDIDFISFGQRQRGQSQEPGYALCNSILKRAVTHIFPILDYCSQVLCCTPTSEAQIAKPGFIIF